MLFGIVGLLSVTIPALCWWSVFNRCDVGYVSVSNRAIPYRILPEMTPTSNRLLLRCLQQHCRWPTAGRFIANFAGLVGFVSVWPVWLRYKGGHKRQCKLTTKHCIALPWDLIPLNQQILSQFIPIMQGLSILLTVRLNSLSRHHYYFILLKLCCCRKGGEHYRTMRHNTIFLITKWNSSDQLTAVYSVECCWVDRCEFGSMTYVYELFNELKGVYQMLWK